MSFRSFSLIFAVVLGLGTVSAATQEKTQGAMPNFKIAKDQLSTAPAPEFNPATPGTRLYNTEEISGGGVRIEDAAAPEGAAISHSAKKTQDQLAKLHEEGFTFGLYEKTWKKMLLIGYVLNNRIPQDEKYHWYYTGTTALYPGLVLWMHLNWELSAELGRYYNAASPDQEYQIYALLKFQGPGYVNESKQQGDIRLAQIALVPVKK